MINNRVSVSERLKLFDNGRKSFQPNNPRKSIVTQETNIKTNDMLISLMKKNNIQINTTNSNQNFHQKLASQSFMNNNKKMMYNQTGVKRPKILSLKDNINIFESNKGDNKNNNNTTLTYKTNISHKRNNNNYQTYNKISSFNNNIYSSNNKNSNIKNETKDFVFPKLKKIEHPNYKEENAIKEPNKIIDTNKNYNNNYRDSYNYNKNNIIKNNNNSLLQNDIKKVVISDNNFENKEPPPAPKPINVNGEVILLNSISSKANPNNNSFCIGFFIASFPKNKNVIVDRSEFYSAECGHEICSMLPGFQPEIVYRYPEKNTKDLEINNSLASICFPNSIKLCYNEERNIKTIKNYRSCFTNISGERLYAIIYHFYIKVDNKNLSNIYNTEFLQKIALICKEESVYNTEKTQNLINLINSKTYVFVPYALCLISKEPHFVEMEKCLNSIFLTLKYSNSQGHEIYELLSLLINSIPSPSPNTSIFFPLPNCNELIKLTHSGYQELSFGDNPISLFDKLNKELIIIIFRLMILEKKILFISEDYNNLTEVSINMISLLYPLEWSNVYIPILTDKMLKYLQSFLPFIFGMHKSLFEEANVQEIISSSHEDLYIIDLDKKTFNISCNLEKNKTNPNKFLNKDVPPLPKKVENIIMQQLTILGKLYEGNQNYVNNNLQIKLIFIQAFIELLSDYKNYLTIVGDNPLLNTNMYIANKSSSDKNFYKEFTSTQIFQLFIQNSINKTGKYYFDELIELYLSRKGKNDNNYLVINHPEYEKEMDERFNHINKNYIIKPFHLKQFKNIDNKFNNQKGISLLRNMNLYLFNEFKEKNNINQNGILNEEKRIIYHDISLSNSKDIKNIQYYVIPGEKSSLGGKINPNNKNSINQNVVGRTPTLIFSQKSLDVKNEEGLSLLEQEEIKDSIKENLTHIFKSDDVSFEKVFPILLSSTESNYGITFFVSLPTYFSTAGIMFLKDIWIIVLTSISKVLT